MAQKPRTAISGPRQTGTITEWKGSFGWIQPTKAVSHPLAAKRGGKIFLAVADVVEELDGVGANVTFTLYSDASGLGAADVKMAKSAPAAKAPAAGKGAAAALGKGANGKSSAVAQYRQAAQQAKEKGTPKGGYQAPAAKARSAPPAAAEPPAKKGKGAAGKSSGKGGKDAGEREPLHDEPLIGTVTQWKGKFGWITPNDTIDHPLSAKHKGDIFLAQEDVEAEIEGVGAVVSFMLYADNRGLGAANVNPAE